MGQLKIENDVLKKNTASGTGQSHDGRAKSSEAFRGRAVSAPCYQLVESYYYECRQDRSEADLEDLKLILTKAQGAQVELLYQSTGYRWAENLRLNDSEGSQRFLRYYEQVPNQPLLVAEERMEVDG